MGNKTISGLLQQLGFSQVPTIGYYYPCSEKEIDKVTYQISQLSQEVLPILDKQLQLRPGMLLVDVERLAPDLYDVNVYARSPDSGRGAARLTLNRWKEQFSCKFPYHARQPSDNIVSIFEEEMRSSLHLTEKFIFLLTKINDGYLVENYSLA